MTAIKGFGCVFALLISACAAESASEPSEGMARSAVLDINPWLLPLTSGTYAGSYIVPASPDLQPAAEFIVPTIDWTVTEGKITLHYHLPVGLVGGDIEITMSGIVVEDDAS